jgi:AraC family transcriptional regulator, positive regulator of tynA and feaB
VETFRTSSLSSLGPATECTKFYSSRLDAAEVIPAAGAPFDAEFRLTQLASIQVVRMRLANGSVNRATQHLDRASPQQYSLLLVTRGSGTLEHYGQQTALGEGDLTLWDSAAPYAFRVQDTSEFLVLRIPADLLREHLPSPESFCGQHLAAHHGLTDSVAALILSLCAQLESGINVGFPDRIARNLLDLVATSYAIAFVSLSRDSSVLNSRYAKVRLFIEQHLRNPALRPSSVAQGLHVSSRYVRMIFAVSRETASEYILRRRLEECARQMADPRWRERSITEIAFAWGFNSAPHFTRKFRGRYGDTPRSYRRQHLQRLGLAGTGAAASP